MRIREAQKHMGPTKDLHIRIRIQIRITGCWLVQVLLLDEAQDMNGSMLDICLRQSCPKIIVGDPHQQAKERTNHFSYCLNIWCPVPLFSLYFFICVGVDEYILHTVILLGECVLAERWRIL
jgi:hypothetical protein